MSQDSKTIRFHCENIHLDDGELAAGEVVCSEREPLEIHLGQKTSDSLKLPEGAHIALGRFDPHVHFRESPLPTREDFEKLRRDGEDYESLNKAVAAANQNYSIRSGCLAALKGGVCCVGAMGNIPWSPVGPERHSQMQNYYWEKGLIPIVAWPRIEPDSDPVPNHEGKDFGSTFGGSGLTGRARSDMYQIWEGEAVSFHNDQPRTDETISEFKDRENPPEALLHHRYFNGDTVLACQQETIEIAKSAKVRSLLARHIPTGPALQQILDTSKEVSFAMPAEVGLDYLYWNQDRLMEQDEKIALINYRRPAHPTREDQLGLIELTRDTVRSGYAIFFGSDHAPHSKAAKAFQNGLPGSPGTRNIEHSLQIYLELKRNHGYTWQDIDLLASINPAKHMARYFDFPYETGTMKSGAMANLHIFQPEEPYTVDEASLSKTLEDPEYHSALKGEQGLFGKTLFTVVDGKAWDVAGIVQAAN